MGGVPSYFSVIPIGSIVKVEDRTWVGSNKPGGVAKVTSFRFCKDSDEILYDVKYVLGGRESDIESSYVSMNERFADLSSPSSLATRSRRKLV